MSDGTLTPVASHCLIGRSRKCVPRLVAPEVSAEHAIVRWRDGVWELQDLHSRNGTYVRGSRLTPGQRVELGAGDVLGCGRLDGLVLVDAGPPLPFARRLEDDVIVEACGRLLALPSSDALELTIYKRGQEWLCERDDRVDVLEDEQVVEAVSGRWRVSLPRSLPPTAEADEEAHKVASLGLIFAVSNDEEYVELVAHAGDQRVDLKARAYHYPLLLLARARLGDSHFPEAERGWLHQEELLDQLRCSSSRLYVYIHRIRRHFAEAGVCDAAQIIERRAGTGLLRIGVASLEIIPLSGLRRSPKLVNTSPEKLDHA